MTIRDSRLDVYVVEGCFTDGNWYPVPHWGSGERYAETKRTAIRYFQQNNIIWALDGSGEKFSRRIRIKRYVRETPVKS